MIVPNTWKLGFRKVLGNDATVQHLGKENKNRAHINSADDDKIVRRGMVKCIDNKTVLSLSNIVVKVNSM